MFIFFLVGLLSFLDMITSSVASRLFPFICFIYQCDDLKVKWLKLSTSFEWENRMENKSKQQKKVNNKKK